MCREVSIERVITILITITINAVALINPTHNNKIQHQMVIIAMVISHLGKVQVEAVRKLLMIT